MAVAVSGDRVGDYRAFMACDAQAGWLEDVERELAAWLHKKYRRWHLDLSADGRHVLDERGLTGTKKSHVAFDLRRQRGSGGESLRARLIETDDSGGTWRTELVAHDHRGHGDGDWIWLSVTNDRGQFVSVPNLAKNLMGALPLTDSTMQFVPEPQLHHHQDVDDVVAVLQDEDRHGLVFVAGTDKIGRSVDGFTKVVAAWTREAYGLAQVIVLDPLATAEFNRRVGPAHAAKAWSVRTFLPGVDLDDPADARRHRYLTRATQSGNVQKLLGVISRDHSAGRQLPSSVERVRRGFERLENRAIVQALATPGPLSARTPALPGLESPQAELPFDVEPTQRRTAEPPAAVAPGQVPAPAQPSVEPTVQTVAEEAERYLAQLSLVKSILGIERLDEATLSAVAEDATRPHSSPEALAVLSADLEAKQAQIDRLRDERSSLQASLEDAQATQVDTQESLDKARDTERWLRGQLRDAQAFEAARAEVPDECREKVPSSFSDLIEALESDPDGDVVFTGDADATLALDVNDLGTACRAAWDAIVTLREYLRARRSAAFEGSVDRFVRHPPAGYRTCPSRRHAKGETAITMQQWGRERVLPVPVAVDPTGSVVMAAHFKLGQIARISPRLHYYDDFIGTGKIYIGYIGRHLTNTHS